MRRFVYAGYNVELDLLLAHGQLHEVFRVCCKQGTTVETGLFVDFTNGTVSLAFLLVDLALWETPGRA